MKSRDKVTYVDLINELNSPTAFTLEWLKNNKVDFAFSENNQVALYEAEKFDKYLVSRVLMENKFEFPYDKIDDDVVVNNCNVNSPIWKYIKYSIELINHIIENELYINIDLSTSYENIIPLYSGKKTSKFVKFIMDKVSNDSEKIEYLNAMGEIRYEKNSLVIAKILIEDKNIKLLIGDASFKKVKERLWEDVKNGKGYKSNFTKKRNKYLENNL